MDLAVKLPRILGNFKGNDEKVLVKLLIVARIIRKVRTNFFRFEAINLRGLFSFGRCFDLDYNSIKRCDRLCGGANSCVLTLGYKNTPSGFVQFAKKAVKLYKEKKPTGELSKIKRMVYDKKLDPLIDEEARRINSLLTT